MEYSGVPFDDLTLAQRLRVTPKYLWFVIRRRNDAYKISRIAKRSGKGTRELHAPEPVLRKLQFNILHEILDKIPLGNHVGAYVRGRGIKEVAQQHVGKAVVVSMDLKDFFPSVHRGTIRAYLHRVQKLPDKLASMLAALMTYKNFVPQGAPTSGAICNLIADWKFDQALLATLSNTGWTYTRYSDDMTFSHAEFQSSESISELASIVSSYAERVGFKVNAEKTRIMVRPNQQKVLGLVVNDKVGVDPEMYRELRATVHNCANTGIAVQATRSRVPVETFLARVKGQLSYLHQIDADKAAPLVQQLEACV